ncbi:MAG: hypothetical protein KAH25_05205 [Bacteroidales bacterium]|nr:hypothetical protein [Bacteroidales bacterium]
MKYLIFITMFFTLSIAKAQTPLTEAVDFSAKDIDGTIHHLFDLLDNQNKYVLIDFFNPT